jgi:hypothetical protein
MEIIERLKDWYLTWRTGKDKQLRDWEKWRDETIVFRAGTVENMFMNFKHIIEVDPNKIFDLDEPFGWYPKDEFDQYLYPTRKLGDNVVWDWCRCRKDQWDGRWHIDELGGEDHVFVATNNDRDAIMIALKYCG